MIGTTIDGRFRIEREAARGGMGAVYEATDLQDGARVAIKVVLALDEDQNAQRFVREIDVLKKLDHPSIVRLIASGVTGKGSPYLVTEWVAAEVLRDRLRRVGLTAPEAVRVTQQLAEALACAHRLGVVHRDVKPSNVLVPFEGVEGVKLIDFGVARFARGTQVGLKTLGLTGTGMTVGTPAYMAPEQISMHCEIDFRVDVFALGCVLYECLTGRQAFVGTNRTMIWLKVLHGDPPPLRLKCPEASAALEQLMGRMLAKDPALRPVDGAAVAAELVALGAITEGPRRVTQPRENMPTETSASTIGAWGVVVLVRPPHAESKIAPEPKDLDWSRDVSVIGGRHEFNYVNLPDGGKASVRRGNSAAQLATLAATGALELQRELPGTAITIVSGPVKDTAQLQSLLERTAVVCQASALEAIFADYADPGDHVDGIRICATTAKWLGKEFKVVEIDETYRLMGV